MGGGEGGKRGRVESGSEGKRESGEWEVGECEGGEREEWGSESKRKREDWEEVRVGREQGEGRVRTCISRQ